MGKNNNNGEKNVLEGIMNSFFKWCKSNVSTLKGIAAITLGAILIFMTLRIIFGIIALCGGFFLIYYGLSLLKASQTKEAIDRFINKLRR